MKIFCLLFAFLFLAFLSEPGNAQGRCHRIGGYCFTPRCPRNFLNFGRMDCVGRSMCCAYRSGK